MANKQGRARLFVENMLVYGLATVLEKVVPLVMLPIVTAMLVDTADYGRYDMFSTIVQFGSSIAGLGIYDAMFREFFEKDNRVYRKNITSTANCIVLLSSFFVSIMIVILKNVFSIAFMGDAGSTNVVLFASLGVLLSTNRNIIAAPIRIENRRGIYIGFSLVGSFVYYLIAIALLKMGYNYMGMIYANIIYSVLLLISYFSFTHKHFSVKFYNKNNAKAMLKIGIPLMPTFLAYWVFSGMNKIMITNMLGLAQEGIYAVGSKLAHISQIVYTAFAAGWQYFAFSTMKDKDQVSLNSKVLEYLGVLSFGVFVVATLFDDFVFDLLFSGDYVLGKIVFPYLFLSPLILMLFQIAANQTLVYKKSYYCTLSLLSGVIVNMLLNYLLIPIMGIKGAAFATLCSYVVSLICIMIVMLKKNWLYVNRKFTLMCILTCTFVIILLHEKAILSLVSAFLVITIIIVFYYKDFMAITCRLISDLKKRKIEK